MYLEKINQILKKYPNFEQLLLQIKCIQELPSIEMDDVHQRDYMYYSLLEKYFDKETQVELITEEDDSYLDLETFLYKYSDKIDWAIKINVHSQGDRTIKAFYYVYAKDKYVANMLQKYDGSENSIDIYFNTHHQKQEIVDSVCLGETLEHLI